MDASQTFYGMHSDAERMFGKKVIGTNGRIKIIVFPLD